MTCTCSSPTAAGLADGRLTMLAVGDTVHAINCWGRKAGICHGTISKRLHDGVPPALAVTRPVEPRRRRAADHTA